MRDPSSFFFLNFQRVLRVMTNDYSIICGGIFSYECFSPWRGKIKKKIYRFISLGILLNLTRFLRRILFQHYLAMRQCFIICYLQLLLAIFVRDMHYTSLLLWFSICSGELQQSADSSTFVARRQLNSRSLHCQETGSRWTGNIGKQIQASPCIRNQ